MPSRIKLESLASDVPVEIVQVDSGFLLLGREPENGIVIDSDSVSRRHACIVEAQSQWVFRDLGSTNGSWVNGVQVHAGQVRILRHHDVIQLADFPVRIVELDPEGQESEERSRKPVSLLVFEGEKFQTEFPFVTQGARFAVGGPNGHFFVDGHDAGVVQLEITYNAGRLELETGRNTAGVIVNGLAAVTGVTGLNDRDEIDVGPFKLAVNALPPDVGQRKAMIGAGTSPSEIRPAQAYDRHNVPEHLQRKGFDDGWSSESARRRAGVPRKFIFDSTPDGPNPMRTIAMPKRSFDSKVGFDLSSSQRFSGAMSPGDKDSRPSFRDYFQVIFGCVVFGIMLAAIILYLKYF